MKKIILLLSFCAFVFSIQAQYLFSFSHYTSDDGLSQNNITAMMKDSKGYMWFGTRDGLNKFDGYNFTIYNSKAESNDNVISKRILTMKEDDWGFVWFKTYDDFLYRFDPSSEEFIRIKNPDNPNNNLKFNKLFLLPSGEIFLSTYQGGCVRVTTDKKTLALHSEWVQHKNITVETKVNEVFQDKEANVWLLTDKGIYLRDSREKSNVYYENLPFYSHYDNDKHIFFGSNGKIFQFDKRSKSFLSIELPHHATVNKMVSLSATHFLFTTHNQGFYTYDILREKLQYFDLNQFTQLSSKVILETYVDKIGDVWIGTESNGVLHFNTQTNSLSFLTTKLNDGQITNPNFLIFEDDKDMLWIQPYLGTFSCYDRSKDKLIPFYSTYNEDINALFTYGVNHIFADEQGVWWLSTNRGNGFYKCTFLPDYFKHYLLEDESVFSIANETRALFEDTNNQLWVATKSGILYVFDENKKLLGSLDVDGSIKPGGHKELFVYNIFEDNEGDIWLATKKQGIVRLIKKSKKNSFQFEQYVHDNHSEYSPLNNDFYSITQDKLGRIWAGSYGGGLHLIEKNGNQIRFLHANNELKNYPIANSMRVRQVFVDSKNTIWVATTEGFVLFDGNFKEVKDIKYHYYNNNKNKPKGLSANDIHCIIESEESDIWVGTFGGGLNKLINQHGDSDFPQFEIFDRSAGLPNNVVYTIVDDNQGSLWLTTDNSIVKFNKADSSFEIFGKGNELENVEFSEASASLLKSGEISVGSKSGFYTFRPEAVIRRKIDAPLVFTKLMLFNKEVQIDENAILKKQLDDMKELVFNHKQNVFSIEFATLDMRAPDKIQYAYKLQGFDKDWSYVTKKQFATYTALPPGDYKLLVKSTDSEGNWLDNQREMSLKVLPSFWQSSFAKFIYFLIGLLVFIITLMIILAFLKLKNNVHLEKQMTEMKLKFFTDISHELRTPLTLISLPVDNLLNEKLDPAIKEQLVSMRRNLDKVLTLINQILDFRKLQNNKLRLMIEEVELHEQVKITAKNFTDIANTNKINFQIIDETGNIKIWIDPEKFESMISNLLSNAFKFTPAGKSITIKSFVRNNKVVVAVVDEGIGIAQEKINFIFDRFFSTSTLKNITQKSTGIGLDLVKKLVELHHASISVSSQVGQGSTFEIEFQQGMLHFADDVNVVVSDSHVSNALAANQFDLETMSEQEEESDHPSDLNPLILIVEDNDELRYFLSNSLNNDYRIVEAVNGLEGWEKIEKLMPDFVISDIRMPVMDGIELLTKVKEDKRTSHIPVILLTAVTDMESKLVGLKAGADDYITKPFSSSILQARIKNLIKQRSLLQQYYRSQMTATRPDISLPPIEVHSLEEVFMKKLMKLMHENIDNFDLNIDYLASELSMSRTVFFNKLKSLTGFSPVEFVREVRFDRAAEYMKNSQYSVSEISYLVGIADPRYFSRCFKQKFGVTPSEYRHSFQDGDL